MAYSNWFSLPQHLDYFQNKLSIGKRLIPALSSVNNAIEQFLLFYYYDEPEIIENKVYYDHVKSYSKDIKLFCQSFNRLMPLIDTVITDILKHSISFKKLKDFIDKKNLNKECIHDKKLAKDGEMSHTEMAEELKKLITNFQQYSENIIELYMFPFKLLLEVIPRYEIDYGDSQSIKQYYTRSKKPLGSIKNYKHTLKKMRKKPKIGYSQDNEENSDMMENMVLKFFKYNETIDKSILIQLYKRHYVLFFLRALDILASAGLLREDYFNKIASTFTSSNEWDKKDPIYYFKNPVIAANIIITLHNAKMIYKIDRVINKQGQYLATALEDAAQANILNNTIIEDMIGAPSLSFYYIYQTDVTSKNNQHIEGFRWYMMIKYGEESHFDAYRKQLAKDLHQYFPHKYIEHGIPLCIIEIIVNNTFASKFELATAKFDYRFMDILPDIDTEKKCYSSPRKLDLTLNGGLTHDVKWLAKLNGLYCFYSRSDEFTKQLKSVILNNLFISRYPDELLSIIMTRHHSYQLNANSSQETINEFFEEISLIINLYKESPKLFNQRFISQSHFKKTCQKLMELRIESRILAVTNINNQRQAIAKKGSYALLTGKNKSVNHNHNIKLHQKNFVMANNNPLKQNGVDDNASSNNSRTNLSGKFKSYDEAITSKAIQQAIREQNKLQRIEQEFIRRHKEKQYYELYSCKFFTLKVRRHFFSYWDSDYANLSIDKIVRVAKGEFSHSRCCFFGTSNSGATTREVLDDIDFNVDQLKEAHQPNTEIKETVIEALLSHCPVS